MDDRRIHDIGLSLVPRLNHAQKIELLDVLGSAEAFFHLDAPSLSEILPHDLVPPVCNGSHLRQAAEVLRQAEMQGLDIHVRGTAAYPARLMDCPDAPVLLYAKGACDLNGPHVLSIVGTRRATGYGKDMTRMLVKDLAALFPDLIVVSGLAYGIDAMAHQAAIECGLKTVAVLAHGLHEVYPSSHRRLAADIVDSGGALLSELRWGTPSEPYRFIERNRIVAGLGDACIVVESTLDGGSLKTAEMADGYHREVMAVPGRTSDDSSRGCNRFIRDNRAILVESADDVAKSLSWSVPVRPKAQQTILFEPMDPISSLLCSKLDPVDGISVDDLCHSTGYRVHELLPVLLQLEMDGKVESLPGGRYRSILGH